jgi:TRAP-type C4-dicarboxylate transport system permease small subunit
MAYKARTFAEKLERIGGRINWINERVCALLVAVMVLIIWYGVLTRYFIGAGGIWTEELSRYVMIWAALMAVPVGAYRREHIGLDLVFQFMPVPAQKALRMGLDLLGVAFFLFLTFYGVGMTKSGAQQYANIFGMTMWVPFASVPVSSALTCFQIVVVMLRDVFVREELEVTRLVGGQPSGEDVLEEET